MDKLKSALGRVAACLEHLPFAVQVSTWAEREGSWRPDVIEAGGPSREKNRRVYDIFQAMLLTPIQVECYAGHKAGEMPRRFRFGVEWVEVEHVLARWYQIESLPEWPRAD